MGIAQSVNQQQPGYLLHQPPVMSPALSCHTCRWWSQRSGYHASRSVGATMHVKQHSTPTPAASPHGSIQPSNTSAGAQQQHGAGAGGAEI